MRSNGFFLFTISIVCFYASVSVYPQQGPAEWYCDGRWTEGRAILKGTVVRIEPVNILPLKKRNTLKQQLQNYSVKNVLRVRIEKYYRNDLKQRVLDERDEILLPNLQTRSVKPRLFKVGGKSLFYLSAVTEFKDDLVTLYVDPNGQTRPIAEAGENITFLEKVYKLDLMRDVLGYDGMDAVIGGTISGKAVFLPKPVYPDEAKKAKASESVRVYVLVDETGQVIKARALCARYAHFARSAENAALNAKFSPIVVTGRPIKVQGTITYNFVP